jgi:hypothetical protein
MKIALINSKIRDYFDKAECSQIVRIQESGQRKKI